MKATKYNSKRIDQIMEHGMTCFRCAGLYSPIIINVLEDICLHCTAALQSVQLTLFEQATGQCVGQFLATYILIITYCIILQCQCTKTRLEMEVTLVTVYTGYTFVLFLFNINCVINVLHN